MSIPFVNCLVRVERPPAGVDPMDEPTFTVVAKDVPACLTQQRGDGTMAGQRIDAVMVLPMTVTPLYGDRLVVPRTGEAWSVSAVVTYRGTPLDHHEVGVVAIGGVQ